jgi:hypothetical protein
MAITLERVREIFKGLEAGDGAAFFTHVAEDVDWTVMGTHPLAGHYLSKKASSMPPSPSSLRCFLTEPSSMSSMSSSKTIRLWSSFFLLPPRKMACASTIATAGSYPSATN